VGFMRRIWQRFRHVGRERLLRRAMLSLAVAIWAATLAAVSATVLFGVLLLLASGASGNTVVTLGFLTVGALGVVCAIIGVLAAVVVILGFVRGFVLLALALTSALQRRKKHPSRLT
jgi:hypothetical protein